MFKFGRTQQRYIMTTLRFTLKNLEGELLPNTQFKISAGYPDDAYDPELELPVNTLFTTDNDGEALVTLEPLNVPYYLTRATDTLDDLIAFKFFVPDSAVTLEAEFTYVDLGSHLHTLSDKSMYTFIETKVILANAVEQVTISTVAATGAASAAAASANAASSSASAALVSENAAEAAQTAAEAAAEAAEDSAAAVATHVADSNAHPQYVRKDGLLNDTDGIWCGTAGGTADALTISLPASPATQVVPVYKVGLRLVFKANTANTGAVTINLNGLGVKSITTEGSTALLAGDIKANGVYEIVYDGTNFQIVGFASTASALKSPEGNCLLSISGSDLLLSRYRGIYVPIGGLLYSIPVGAVSLTSSGVSAGTYYVYIYNNVGTLALEISATAYAVDTTSGVMIKSGDGTRTLVGMAHRGASNWELCRSWFNGEGFVIRNNFTAERSSANADTYSEINSEIRCSFLSWDNELVRLSAHGTIRIDSTNVEFRSSISVDGVVQDVNTMMNSYATNANMPLSQSFVTNQLTEGLHYATIVGRSTANTYSGHYSGGATSSERTTLEVCSFGSFR